VVALLRRTAPDGPQPVLRLGALGICFPLEGRRPKALLGPMARAILAVLREARRELGRV
jgi:hypothetical protein